MSYIKAMSTTAFLMIIIPILAVGCSIGNTKIINEPIDVQTAYNMIQSNKDNPNFVIIDIRTQEEFNSGHIGQATMIDYYLPDFKEKLSQLDRNKQYLIYCRTARRTGETSKIMKDIGFRTVYDMAGGITRWKAEGLPVVN